MDKTLQGKDRADQGPPIERLRAAAYRIPTDAPESDGTLSWDATTLIVVHLDAGGRRGFGYGYANAGVLQVIADLLAPVVEGRPALALPACWEAMRRAIRNQGRGGLAAMAVAAVDAALWDLKAKLLDLPLALLLGPAREAVPVYGSGGFTSYDDDRLRAQLAGWAGDGIPRVKMKIGRDPARDPARIASARDAIGPDTELFVDANGGYAVQQALAMAEVLAEHRVGWYEEPVPQHDHAGLAFLRGRVPAGIDVTAGEYGFTADDFRLLLACSAVDVLMADATRCGITGFIEAAAICQAHDRPLSAHCAPSLHLHLGCALGPVRHLEYFHDHVRIEGMLFDGAITPDGGRLAPDLSRPGLGVELKDADAQRYAL